MKMATPAEEPSIKIPKGSQAHSDCHPETHPNYPRRRRNHRKDPQWQKEKQAGAASAVRVRKALQRLERRKAKIAERRQAARDRAEAQIEADLKEYGCHTSILQWLQQGVDRASGNRKNPVGQKRA